MPALLHQTALLVGELPPPRVTAAATAVTALVMAAHTCTQPLQLSGLRVLSSLAAGAVEGELAGEALVPTSLLDKLLALVRDTDTHTEVRAGEGVCACRLVLDAAA